MSGGKKSDLKFRALKFELCRRAEREHVLNPLAAHSRAHQFCGRSAEDYLAMGLDVIGMGVADENSLGARLSFM